MDRRRRPGARRGHLPPRRDGRRRVLTPRPGVVHQRAAHRLAVLLDAAADGFEVLPAVNVNLGGRALVTPDITVVTAAAAAVDRAFVDAGDVLLAVEITTADTAVTDRVTRPALYAEAGIGHLWRLDLEPAPHLWVGALESGVYATVARVPGGRTARVPAPVVVQLDPAALAAPLPG
ncbi:Uma2 family endonuclease [Streptomyces sp. NPDC002523]